MYLVESKGGAIACMLLALVFLGTWPAILAQLERRGRLPQHTYLDYSLTNLLTAVVIAFTVGQIGDGKPNMPNFITQLSQDNWPCILIAMAGGVFLSLGNLSTQYAWAFVGLSVTEVITSSIAVVLGTTLNYFLDDRINKAEILFPGVGCFLIAVCLGSAVHSSNAADNAAKLGGLSDRCTDGARAEVISNNGERVSCKDGMKDLENGSNKEDKARVGSAHHLIELENHRAIKVFGKSIWLGLSITFFAGVCYSLFSPAFNLATNNQWHMMKRGVANLVVYTAFFYFSLSFFVIALVLNVWFLYRPVLNLPRSSLKSYLKDWNGRNWAFLAGVICGLGNGLQFMGGQAAGYAAADCVQALPLVSTFWGVLFFGEYWRSSRRTYILLSPPFSSRLQRLISPLQGRKRSHPELFFELIRSQHAKESWCTRKLKLVKSLEKCIWLRAMHACWACVFGHMARNLGPARAEWTPPPGPSTLILIILSPIYSFRDGVELFSGRSNQQGRNTLSWSWMFSDCSITGICCSFFQCS